MTLSAALLVAALPLTPVAAESAAVSGNAVAARTCPAAEPLVARATWHRSSLGPGVRLAQATVGDSRGRVSMDVLRIRLASRRVRIEPLMTTLASRLPLSALSAGHARLVASTNTGYFDFLTGAPTGPFIAHRRGEVLSRSHELVAGIGTDNRAQAGQVWLRGSITDAGRHYALVAVNELNPPVGLSLFTAQWGSHRVRLHGGVTRIVTASHHLTATGRSRAVRRHGSLVVARGARAVRALKAMRTGSHVTVGRRIETTAPAPFRLAFGVGSVLVAHPRQSRDDFPCDSANTPQPARTAIGFANHGRTLVLAEVGDHPGTRLHGLDNTQMSSLMVQLGVSRAFDFDGSGSTEMLARRHGSHRLSLLTYPADGAERPMPVGLGIFD